MKQRTRSQQSANSGRAVVSCAAALGSSQTATAAFGESYRVNRINSGDTVFWCNKWHSNAKPSKGRICRKTLETWGIIHVFARPPPIAHELGLPSHGSEHPVQGNVRKTTAFSTEIRTRTANINGGLIR